MLKTRMIYSLLLLVSAACFLLYEPYLFHLLFVMLLLLPALSLIAALPLVWTVYAEVSFPRKEAPKGAVPITFRAENRSLLPCPYILFQMRYQNMLGRSRLQIFQYQKERVRFTVGTRDAAAVQTTFYMPYCGKTDIELTKVCVCDMLGLFALPLRHAKRSVNSVYVQPAASFPVVLASPAPAVTAEGELYSKTQAGKDATEIFQLREYAPGDRLRDIHWKLSARMDQLIAKEYGQPLVPLAHFLLELQDGVETEAADRMLSLFYSFALTLSQRELVYRVSWMPHSASFESKTIASAGEIPALMQSLLSLPGVEAWRPLEQLILNGTPDSGSHLVYFAAGVTEGLVTPDELAARMNILLTQSRFDRVSVFLDSAPKRFVERLRSLGCAVYAIRDSLLQKEAFFF